MRLTVTPAVLLVGLLALSPIALAGPSAPQPPVPPDEEAGPRSRLRAAAPEDDTVAVDRYRRCLRRSRASRVSSTLRRSAATIIGDDI
jgi:hypothetical protein